MRDTSDKALWGQVEKLGRGTKANYDPARGAITFCFNRGPQTSGDDLKASRERLMRDLKGLGYDSRMRFNGEVVVEGVAEEDVVVVKKNHKIMIHLNKKQAEKDPSALNL